MGASVCDHHLKPLRIAYKVGPDQFGSYLYSAMLNVQIALPPPNSPRTKRFEVVIDSGATRCLFDSSLAEYIGIDLKTCPVEVTQGIGGDAVTYIHDIALFVPGGPIVIKAGFKENLPVAGLLGMNGFFEHFRVVFDPTGKYCELERIYEA